MTATAKNFSELKELLGAISDEDCRLLIEEYGSKDSTNEDIVRAVFEVLETSNIESVPDLVWNIRDNPCFARTGGSFRGRKKSGGGASGGDAVWSVARSKGAKQMSGTPILPPAKTEPYHNESPLPMPYSGTTKPVQILRAPKGIEISSLRTYLSKYIQDSEMRHVIYDVYEHRSPKVLILMRGASGSGKTTLASILWAITEKGEICSADNYFVNRAGVYKFSRSSLPAAHDSCKNRARAALSRGDSPVIIDNTNTRVDEMLPYVQMAVEHNYDVKIVEPKTEWRHKAGRLAIKTIHGVPKQTIESQLERFEKTSVKSLVDRAIGLHKMDRNNYRPIQDLDWGGASAPVPSRSLQPSPPLLNSTGGWSVTTWTNPQPPQYNQAPQPPIINSLTPTPPQSPAKTKIASPFKHSQLNWIEPIPVAPSSPRKIFDLVPDLNSASGRSSPRGKKGKKNGNGSNSSASSSPPAQILPPVINFEDPAHMAFKKLQRFFPTVDKAQLEEVFNGNDGDLDACALALLEKGFEMAANLDDALAAEEGTGSGSSGISEDGSEEKSDINWDAGSASDGGASGVISGAASNVDPCDKDAPAAISNGDNNHQLLYNILSSANDYQIGAGGGGDEPLFPTLEEEPETMELKLPVDFARVLLGAFGHPEDEARALSMEELTVKIGTDVAFEIYKGLYLNMHRTEMGVARSNSEETSTRSSSPISVSSSNGGEMDDEFDQIAISLCQMQLETSSGNPQLANIMEIENKLRQDTQESLRGYSARYRTMAQNITFSMLKQDYPHLDAAIVDEVYSQSLLDDKKARAYLNEMYPSSAGASSNKTQSTSDNPESWRLKYNPRDVQLYSQEQLRNMQKTHEELEQEWANKMAKIRDYHARCKNMSNPQIKAHYVSEANKLSEEMRELLDEIQYYKAISLNAKHKNDNILDLHGLRVNGSMRVLKEFLQFKEEEFLIAGTPKMILLIITGQGKHSRNKCPVLQPAVANFLHQKNYKFHSAKPGTFTVILTKGNIAKKKF